MKHLNRLEQDALRRALCGLEDAPARWQALAKDGATDKDIVEQLNYEFGLGGGSSGPEKMPERHKAKPPRVWLGWYNFHGRPPTLSGQLLIKTVRQMFDIAQPGQIHLFQEERKGQ